jgi:putative membrane-bound dehydrogenase-like protein
VDPRDLPRVPPTEPARAAATFQIKPGFRFDQVAAEPLVLDPIALSFDEDGRLYVVEMRDYSERRTERLGCIRLLQDTHGTGHFDRSTVFARDLPWPTAVLCWNGGVFVAATPDVFYLKDTDGDGVADVREVIFTGFASDYAPYQTNKLNVQAMLNSFNWSLDNRVHGATSFNGGLVRRVDSPFVRAWRERHRPAGTPSSSTAAEAPALNLRGRDFSFDPRLLDLRPESGGGQYGLSFDNHGRKFVCSNSSHLQALLYEDRYAARIRNSPLPRVLADIAVDGGAAPVYRISPDEPWRVIRTRWRVTGVVPGLIEGGGRPSGYFTGATGITIYRGNAFPPDMVGDAFVADCGSNLIHHKKVRPDGVSFRGERPADEQQVEFVASRDNWFRPVQMANAPDGTLYVCDMYREIIEHPWSLPPTLKKHLDLNSGNDRGRLYRIAPANFKQPKAPRLSRASTAELVRTLEHPNGWHRDTAARLLCERNDPGAVPAVRKLARASKSALGRLHAWSVLASLNGFTETDALAALDDSSAEVRRQAARLAERLLPGSVRVTERMSALGDDPDVNVRLQIAFSLGAAGAGRMAGLTKILGHTSPDWKDSPVPRCDLEQPLLRAAVLNSAANAAGELLTAQTRDLLYGRCSKPAARAFFSLLAESLAAGNRPEDTARVVEFIAGLTASASPSSNASLGTLEPLAIAAAFGDSLQQRGAALGSVDGAARLDSLFELARTLTPEQRADEELREAAARLLGHDPHEAEAAQTLLSLVAAEPPNPVVAPGLQKAALTALGRHLTPPLTEALLQRWARLTPDLRKSAVQLLLLRPDRARLLLQAVADGRLQRTELDAAQQQFLRQHKDPGLRAESERLLATPAAGTRQEVVDAFRPALELTGNAARGLRVFNERCAVCHRLGALGQTLGPDLATVKAGGKEKLLINILDPNREVNANYYGYLAETRNGDSISGILAAETAAGVTIRQAGGVETTLLRANLVSLQSQGKSLMPEGLEAGLSPQDLADLMEFIVAP